jgi:hypothetical protein
MRPLQRLRELDDRVLGRPVPDDRSAPQRLVSPVPVVRTRLGRAVYFLLLVGMIADLRWAGDGTVGVVVFVALIVGSFVTVAWDMRRSSGQFWNRR